MSSGRSLRVLHVVPTYLPAARYGGPIHSVHGLCRHLVQAGHQVSVYTTSVDGAGRSNVPEGRPVDVDGVQVTYFRSRFNRLYWAPAMRRALRASIRNFDLVHLHSVFLWPTAAAASVARRAGLPYLLAPRGMLVPELISGRSSAVKRAWIALVERRNLAGAARIHVTSASEADDLRRCGLMLAPKLEVPNGVDIDEPTSRHPASGVVLYLGRLSWKKNLIALVDAIAALPAATLLLAGPDDEGLAPILRQRAAEGGCADRVRLLGVVGREEKTKLFASADCAVLPSINENFGNVVVEALAQGCPVVVSPGVGARSIVEASGGGIVAEGANAESLRIAIDTLLADPWAADLKGVAGSEFVRANLGWPAIAERMATAYREVCGEVHR